MIFFARKKVGMKNCTLSYNDFEHGKSGIWYDPPPDPQDLVNDWITKDKIIIDEYVWPRRENCKVIEKALQLVREQKPNIYIALWINPFTSKRALKRMAPNVDLFIEEMYFPWKSNFMLFWFIKFNYIRMKNAKVAHRSIFGLGINEVIKWDFCKIKQANDKWSTMPWASTEKRLRKQISYIKKKCKLNPGVGFFNIDSGPTSLLADKIAGEYF